MKGESEGTEGRIAERGKLERRREREQRQRKLGREKEAREINGFEKYFAE